MKDIMFATSFSPEAAYGAGDDNPMKSLRVIHERLGINDFRLGLRWNKVEFKKGKISLKEYEKYIQYCLERKCKICLNVGPIKVMRWPEEHIPDWINTDGINIVEKNSDLAKCAYEYFHKVLKLLKKEYGKELDPKNGISFQIENESYNKFGHKGIIMSEEYMVEIANILHEYFPKNNLMLDSSARNDLRKIMNLFEILIDKKIYTWKQLVIGLNFYFRLPNNIPFLKRMNPWIFSRLFSMSLRKLKKLQRERDFGIEISEAQFEPWGFQKAPGNSYGELEYVLKIATEAFPEEYFPKVIRLWGTEELAIKMKRKELTNEHSLIIEKMRNVNSTLA